MKKYAMLIASLHLLFCSQLLAFDEDFWINATASVQRDLRYVANIAANDGTIFAATGAGLWRSDNTGATWEHVPITDYGILPGVTILRDGTVMVGGRDSLHFSTNGGDTWTTYTHLEHDIPQIDYYRFVENNDGALFVAMNRGYSGLFVPLGIWESRDRGRSWSLVCAETETSSESMCIALHPNGDVFWGSWLWQGLFVLRAETGECHNVNTPFGGNLWDPLSMAINSRGEILVGTNISRVAYLSSTNAGNDWTEHNHLEYHSPHGNIHSIIVDRFDNFIVSARDTVWYTDDLAQTWTRLPGYLEKFEIIYSLCLDSSDYLYVGTQNGRIYRSREPIYSVTGLNTPEPTDSEFNFSLSPNPTARDLTLDFTLETQGLVTAELFDMRGVLVKQVFSRQYSAGSHRTTNKMDFVVAGVYVLKLSRGSKVLTTLVTFIR